MSTSDKPTPPVAPAKPPKPLSRLANLAARVISAGEAFEQDLKPVTSAPVVAAPAPAPKPQKAPTPAPAKPPKAVKRTFRFSKDLDSDLKRFVHRYNLEKRDDDADLTMDEVGVIMARHFLASQPKTATDKARGRP